MLTTKIAFISYTFSFGGIQKSMLMIAQQLSPRGFEFHFISCDRDDFQDQFHKYGICRHIPDEHDLLAYLMENQIDIVQLNHSRHGGLLAYLAGVKGIVERVDGLKSAFMFDKYPVDCVISSTKRVFEASQNKYPEKYNVKIVNGVDLQRFAPSGNNPSLRKHLGIDANDIVVGYAGRMSEEKCIDKLIDVFADISRIHDHIKLAILGTTTRPNEQMYYEYLQEKIQKLNLGDKIFFLPQTEFPETSMNIFDIGVYIAGTYIKPDGTKGVTVEGYTNALLELAAMEIPLVATNSGDVSGVVIDGHNGYVVGLDDMDAFRNRLLKLINSASLRKSMGEHGRQFIRENFSLSVMAEQYEHLYRFVMSETFSQQYPNARQSMKYHYFSSPFQMENRIQESKKILIFRSGSEFFMHAILELIDKYYDQPDVYILCHQNNFSESSQLIAKENIFSYNATPSFEPDAMQELISDINKLGFDYLFFIYNDFLGRGCDNIAEIVQQFQASATIVIIQTCGKIRSFNFPH